MIMNTAPTPSSRRSTPLDHAKSLAVVLREEFGVPLAFYETETGSLVWFDDLEQLREQTSELSPSEVLAMVKEGRARVTLGENGWHQFVLPVYQGGRMTLVASGALARFAAGDAEAATEQQRLQRWVQAVCDRLRSSDQMVGYRLSADDQGTQVKQAWEVILTLDHLLRHQRPHKDPLRNQQRILEAAYGLLHVQSLLWVPLQPDAQVVIQGEACLAPTDCRLLANNMAKSLDAKSTGPLVFNHMQENSWGTAFPHLHNVMAFRVVDQRLAGWVIAVNKKSEVRSQKSAKTKKLFLL